MISQTIKTWNARQGKDICFMLYQETPLGVFNFTNLEAEVKEELDPVSLVCLSLADELKVISRFEVAAISGMMESDVGETLDELVSQNLLQYVEFDEDQFKSNFERINAGINGDWIPPMLKGLISRTILRQYTITKQGSEVLQARKKTITTATDLGVVVSGTPFFLFKADVRPRANTYNDIEMSPELISQILSMVKSKAHITGINPLGLNPSATISGKSVNNAQIWVAFNNESNSQDSNSAIYLTSETFDRWSNPPWDSELIAMFPQFDNSDEITSVAFAHTYDFNEEVIREGMKYIEGTWIVEVDLEMQKIILDRDADLIKYPSSEVILELPETQWKVVIQLSLVPYLEDENDTLASHSLIAARFHALASRKGFSYNMGYDLFADILIKQEMEPDKASYDNILSILVKYDCLTEKMPDISRAVIDLDNLLDLNRRSTQKWQFHRIRQLTSLLSAGKVEDVTYVYTEQLTKRIDELENFEQWISKENGIQVKNSLPIPEVLKIAVEKDAVYIGNQLIPKNKELKILRQYKRQIKYRIDRNTLTIRGLEPFYEWRMNNILEEMYQVFY